MDYKVSAEKSADNLIEFPLYVINCFSLAAFKIFPLTFAILIITCLVVNLFGFILFGTLYASCTWMSVSFPRLGKFSAIISSNRFSVPFSLFSRAGTQ